MKWFVWSIELRQPNCNVAGHILVNNRKGDRISSPLGHHQPFFAFSEPLECLCNMERGVPFYGEHGDEVLGHWAEGERRLVNKLPTLRRIDLCDSKLA